MNSVGMLVNGLRNHSEWEKIQIRGRFTNIERMIRKEGPQFLFSKEKNAMTNVCAHVEMVNLLINVSIDSNKLTWNGNERPLKE